MTDKEKEVSPFARPAFIVASVFMGALAVGGAYLGISSAMSETPSRLDVPASTSSVSSPSTQAEGGRACPASSFSDSLDPIPAAETLWVREGLSVPKVEGVGPLVVEGLPRCWTHSSNGALLASVSVVKQLFTQENHVQVVETYVEDSPARQKLLDTKDQANPEPKPQMRVLGYKFSHVEADFVIVDIALGAQWISDTPISVTAQMAWDNEALDWKLVLNTNGWNMTYLTSDITSAGYSIWDA